jgi:hypothetical protein
MILYQQNWTVSQQSWAVSSTVERLPYKQDVTGSNPVLPIFQINPHVSYRVCLVRRTISLGFGYTILLRGGSIVIIS